MKAGRLLVTLAMAAVLGAWAKPMHSKTPIHVKIDIEPGSSAKIIVVSGSMSKNEMSDQMVPVAILSTKSFDATTVNVSTAALGNDGMNAMASSFGYGFPRATIRDVNGDGIRDMVLQFPVAALMKDGALVHPTTRLCLTAKTSNGQSIRGCGSVRVPGQ
ncbi:MAG: hypothetical protein P8099_13495 [Gemmatimonadota bacterium]